MTLPGLNHPSVLIKLRADAAPPQRGMDFEQAVVLVVYEPRCVVQLVRHRHQITVKVVLVFDGAPRRIGLHDNASLSITRDGQALTGGMLYLIRCLKNPSLTRMAFS